VAKLSPAILTLLAAVACPPLVAAQAPAGGGPETIDRPFPPRESGEAPGCAVAASHKGETVISRAYGSANLEHGIGNTPATVFEAGSASKQFTAAAILLLVEDGRLSLTDDIRKHLPEMPE
jgi:CubicO group peptidase (beta-lactamase class C family)